MSQYKKGQSSISPETIDDANKAAKATQRPGQSKEQTKLIAQGIQKGIDHYKKQHKAKARELNKQLKKAKQPTASADENEPQIQIHVQHSKLAWLLLGLSWLAFVPAVAYLLLR